MAASKPCILSESDERSRARVPGFGPRKFRHPASKKVRIVAFSTNRNREMLGVLPVNTTRVEPIERGIPVAQARTQPAMQVEVATTTRGIESALTFEDFITRDTDQKNVSDTQPAIADCLHRQADADLESPPRRRPDRCEAVVVVQLEWVRVTDRYAAFGLDRDGLCPSAAVHVRPEPAERIVGQGDG